MDARAKFFAAPINLRRSEIAGSAEQAEEIAAANGGFAESNTYFYPVDGAEITVHSARWLVVPKPDPSPAPMPSPIAVMIAANDYTAEEIAQLVDGLDDKTIRAIGGDVAAMKSDRK